MDFMILGKKSYSDPSLINNLAPSDLSHEDVGVILFPLLNSLLGVPGRVLLHAG